MPAPVIASVSFTAPKDASSGEAELTVSYRDGGASTFKVATFDRAEEWMKKSKSKAWWSAPVLFVARLDKPTVDAAVAAMAAEMGGYWLRYYNRRKA